MDRHAQGILGKRVQRAATSDESKGTSTRRTLKRTKTQAKQTQQMNYLTPETSSLIEESPTPFPFMRLPAELRINVYHKALVRDEPLLLHAARVPENTSNESLPAVPTSRWEFPPSPHPRPIRERVAHPHDPIVPQLLRTNSLIYKEARQILYSDNIFILHLTNSIHTLSTLHQRSRSLIKHVTLIIPSHHDILDGFADLVRLGLRYCWGLKSFRIILQASLPDDHRSPSTASTSSSLGGATSVYANAFHILRWLPRGCSVQLEGNVSDGVRRVVAEEGRLQNILDDTSYLKRQHQMPERH